MKVIVTLLVLVTACAPARYTKRMLANVSTDVRSQRNPALDTVAFTAVMVYVDGVSRLRRPEYERFFGMQIQRAWGRPVQMFSGLGFLDSEDAERNALLSLTSRSGLALLHITIGSSGYDEYMSNSSSSTSVCATRDLSTGRCTSVRTQTTGPSTISKPFAGIYARVLDTRSLRAMWIGEISGGGGGLGSVGDVSEALARDLAARLLSDRVLR